MDTSREGTTVEGILFLGQALYIPRMILREYEIEACLDFAATLKHMLTSRVLVEIMGNLLMSHAKISEAFHYNSNGQLDFNSTFENPVSAV